ncbi:MAG: universal stress protein [Saprospiraceae bacterium]|nr:amino acid permease [Lewinella sp.]
MKKLERSLSLPYVIAIAIGGMLGSGIFVLPGIAVAKTGPSVWLAYLLAGLCILPAVLSKSELATAMPTSGGTYVYIERTFGPLLGTISGLGLWLSLLLKSSFALVGLGAYLLVIADFPLKTVALISLGLILMLNIFGIKKVGKVQLVVVSLSVTGLLVLLIFGIINIEPANLEPAFTHGQKGLISAIAFVYISFAGVTKVAAIAEEIKDPNRNLPLAMVLSLVLITAIYSLVTFSLVGNIPVDQLTSGANGGPDIHPIYTFAHSMGGKIAGYAAAVIGVITLISMANSGVLAASRFPFAMGRDKLLPGLMTRIHQKHLTPVVTIFLTCSMMALVIIFLDVEKIAKLASAFKVTMFIIVNACVIVLRETAVQWYQPSYRAPLYPYIQIFGIISGFVLLAFLGAFSLVVVLLISVLGLLIYWLYGRKWSNRSGVLQRYGHRPALLSLDKNKKAEPAHQAPSNWITGNAQTDLTKALTGNAQVVVPLFGKERSPEMLTEMGAALSEHNKLQVIHITEVPDQTMLDALLEDKTTMQSLNRRIGAMAADKKIEVGFDGVVTHDMATTLQEITNQTLCRWMVMGWNGRERNGILIHNPIGWLLGHLNCNFALFKDQGIRYIRRILVCLRPGRNNPHFLEAAGQIARFYDAELLLCRIVPSNFSDAEIDSLRHLSKMLLTDCGVTGDVLILKNDDPLEAIAKESARHDLMLIGTAAEQNFKHLLVGTGRDKFTESAACSVLRLTIQA